MGGGISYQTGLSKKGSETSKINLSDSKATETALNLDSLKLLLPAQKLNLEDKEENSLNLSSVFSADKDSSSLSASISRIHTEIGREGRVVGINQQLESQYSSLLEKQLEKATDKQQKHFQNFQDVKRQITGQTRSGRGKREVQQVTMTQAQRDAIQRMFNLHHDLKEESKKLSKKLEAEFFNGLMELLKHDLPQALSRTSSINVEEIKKSLKEIDWTGQSIKTQKNRARGSTGFYSARSWGTWVQNPFRHFYSQEKDFKTDIQKLQSSAMNAHRAKQEQARLQQRSSEIWSRSRSMWPLLEKQYAEINKRIADLEASQDSHIVNKVANSLLKYMGQTY